MGIVRVTCRTRSSGADVSTTMTSTCSRTKSWAKIGRYARFPIFAQDFVRLQVDVIVVETSAPVDLVRQVTRTIPIVMGYSVDPVGSGLVTSLTRPGANVTGMTSSMEPTLPKQ